jgi:lauroyl/myristoyl acyltransferase
MGGRDQIAALAETHPVMLVSLHFGGIFALPALLRAHGIPTASVVGGKLWPIRWWRRRRAQLTQISGLPTHFQAGDAWSIRHFMVPGRCVLVALDYPMGEQVSVPYGGVSLELSTPPFRLARLTGAAVVPVIVRADGAWRFKVHVCRPVPDAVIAAGDYAAAAAHVANELLPMAEDRPEQAMPLLVASIARPLAS